MSTRRAFLKHGCLWLMAPGAVCASEHTVASPGLRVGLVTDLHYADKPPAGSRHYRETRQKLSEAADFFGKQRLHCLIELGDLIDAAPAVEVELSYLKKINEQFSSICEDRHYVLGNHCVDTLTKPEFLNAVGQERSYYSFDRQGIHCVVLDSCFRQDGAPYGRRNFQWTDANIPQEELDWLAADLRNGDSPTVVFAHQRLDVANQHGVKNNSAVRKILEESGRVRAVFQGHSHRNDLQEINGVFYCTMVAMVEGSGLANSGYSVLEIDPDGSIKVTGQRKQVSRSWPVSG